MADENKVRDAADAIKGIVEAVPVYQDLAQPAVQELGKDLQTVAKAVHIALAPVAALVWGFEQFKEFVSTRVAQKLEKVPADKIVTPATNIAGPALEALKYNGQQESLQEMYANLLATAMNADTMKLAHPAFVEIIKQMTPDEAKLFRYLTVHPNIRDNNSREITLKQTGVGPGQKTVVLKLCAAAQCEDRENGLCYIDNLCRLGMMRLIEHHIPPESRQYRIGAISALSPMPIMRGAFPSRVSADFATRKFLFITDLGVQFAKACITEDLNQAAKE